MKWSDRNDDNQLQTKRHIPRPDQHQTGQADRFGLFADFGGEDYMSTYVRHPVIHKPADDTLNPASILSLGGNNGRYITRYF